MKDTRADDPRRLDVVRFAARDGSLDGDSPAAAWRRLTEDAPLQPGTDVTWRVDGEIRQASGRADQPWLHLRAMAQVVLTCQRCLQSMTQPLEVDRWIHFVATEAEAERLDEESEDDVLALPPQGLADVMGLLEDELILSMPIVPRHEQCLQPLPQIIDAEPVTANPFQALATLKQRSTGNNE